MTSKVKPSEKNLENLRKAEQAWLGGGIWSEKLIKGQRGGINVGVLIIALYNN